MNCPTCRGNILEFFEDTNNSGVRIQVVRCINGHRFEREKPVAGKIKEKPARMFKPLAEVVTPATQAVETLPIMETEKETGMGRKKPQGECAKCKRDMPLVSRGLCGKCYYVLKRAGTLDSQYPSKVQRVVKAVKSPAPPDEEEPPVIVSEDSGREDVSPKTKEAATTKPFTFAAHLAAVIYEIESNLLAKNAAYGDSAFNPVRVFSKADPLEQINVRLDDKLSRLMRGDDAGEDTEADLLGYLILKRVAIRRQGK